MPEINWEQFKQDGDAAIENAAEATDEALAGNISRLTRLTEQEVLKICPTKGDVQKLSRLIHIVKQHSAENERAKQLTDDIEDVATVAVRVLKLIL